MSISDELREWAELQRKSIYTMRNAEKLDSIADRIDAEMVELPRDKDGVPIHVGDFVYLDDGRRACVTEIDIKDDREYIDCWDGSRHVACPPYGITHNRPDSWDLIADELEKWCDSADVDGDACGKPRDLVDRIRRLAERDEERRAASSACTSTSTCTSTPKSGLTIAYGRSSHDDGFCSCGEPVEEDEW